MKFIFLINSSFPNYAGGIENWLYHLTKRLIENHEVSIFSYRSNNRHLFYNDLSPKIKIQKIVNIRSFKLFKPLVRRYFVLLDLFIGSLLMGLKLKKHLPTNEECYIIALDSMFCVKSALIGKGKRKNVKLISSVRGPHAEVYANSFPAFSNFSHAFEKRMLSFVDSIWANGYDTADLLKKKGFSSTLMINGVDFNSIQQVKLEDNEFKLKLNEKPSIISVGTLLPIKGGYKLIDAVSNLKNKSRGDFQIVFIGKGDKTPFLKYAKKHNLEGSVIFLGHKNNPAKFVKECTISACLSGGSGMSMAAIESMATGVPIIAWNSAVYQQFNKDCKTMLLVENENSDALASGILDIMNNYEYFQKIGIEAKRVARDFDWSVVCQQFLENINL